MICAPEIFHHALSPEKGKAFWENPTSKSAIGNQGERAILKVCVLGSGSSGNAIYVETPKVRLLIDAGFSGKELGRRLNGLGRCAEELGAILLSHEHTDHIQGVKVLTKRHGIPLYLTEGTHKGAKEALKGSKEFRHFSPGQGFPLEDLWIEPFSVPHDANDPVGFNLYLEEKKVSIALDLGYITRLIQEKMRRAHLIVLESNHDLETLKGGPYPWPLKQRILGKRGHLSNCGSSSFLRELLHPGLSHVVLAHVSQVNNHYALVQAEACKVLQGQEVALHLAQQDCPTALIALERDRQS